LRISFWDKDKKRVDKYVHILVAKLFITNAKNYPFVNHKDGDKTNNHYKNLEWVSAKQNTLHAYKIGTMKPKPGESNPFCKIKNKDVELIRKSYTGKRGDKTKLALKFNVSVAHICRILSGQSRASIIKSLSVKKTRNQISQQQSEARP